MSDEFIKFSHAEWSQQETVEGISYSGVTPVKANISANTIHKYNCLLKRKDLEEQDRKVLLNDMRTKVVKNTEPKVRQFVKKIRNRQPLPEVKVVPLKWMTIDNTTDVIEGYYKLNSFDAVHPDEVEQLLSEGVLLEKWELGHCTIVGGKQTTPENNEILTVPEFSEEDEQWLEEHVYRYAGKKITEQEAKDLTVSGHHVEKHFPLKGGARTFKQGEPKKKQDNKKNQKNQTRNMRKNQVLIDQGIRAATNLRKQQEKQLYYCTTEPLFENDPAWRQKKQTKFEDVIATLYWNELQESGEAEGLNPGHHQVVIPNVRMNVPNILCEGYLRGAQIWLPSFMPYNANFDYCWWWHNEIMYLSFTREGQTQTIPFSHKIRKTGACTGVMEQWTYVEQIEKPVEGGWGSGNCFSFYPEQEFVTIEEVTYYQPVYLQAERILQGKVLTNYSLRNFLTDMQKWWDSTIMSRIPNFPRDIKNIEKMWFLIHRQSVLEINQVLKEDFEVLEQHTENIEMLQNVEKKSLIRQFFESCAERFIPAPFLGVAKTVIKTASLGIGIIGKTIKKTISVCGTGFLSLWIWLKTKYEDFKNRFSSLFKRNYPENFAKEPPPSAEKRLKISQLVPHIVENNEIPLEESEEELMEIIDLDEEPPQFHLFKSLPMWLSVILEEALKIIPGFGFVIAIIECFREGGKWSNLFFHSISEILLLLLGPLNILVRAITLPIRCIVHWVFNHGLKCLTPIQTKIPAPFETVIDNAMVTLNSPNVLPEGPTLTPHVPGLVHSPPQEIPVSTTTQEQREELERWMNLPEMQGNTGQFAFTIKEQFVQPVQTPNTLATTIIKRHLQPYAKEELTYLTRQRLRQIGLMIRPYDLKEITREEWINLENHTGPKKKVYRAAAERLEKDPSTAHPKVNVFLKTDEVLFKNVARSVCNFNPEYVVATAPYIYSMSKALQEKYSWDNENYIFYEDKKFCFLYATTITAKEVAWFFSRAVGDKHDIHYVAVLGDDNTVLYNGVAYSTDMSRFDSTQLPFFQDLFMDMFENDFYAEEAKLMKESFTAKASVRIKDQVIKGLNLQGLKTGTPDTSVRNSFIMMVVVVYAFTHFENPADGFRNVGWLPKMNITPMEEGWEFLKKGFALQDNEVVVIPLLSLFFKFGKTYRALKDFGSTLEEQCQNLLYNQWLSMGKFESIPFFDKIHPLLKGNRKYQDLFYEPHKLKYDSYGSIPTQATMETFWSNRYSCSPSEIHDFFQTIESEIVQTLPRVWDHPLNDTIRWVDYGA